jgi:predicted nucleotidyltransferase
MTSKMKTLQEVKDVLKLHKEELRRKYKVKEIGVLALSSKESRGRRATLIF